MSSTHKLPSPDDAQYNLFGGVPASTDAPLLQTAVQSGRRFVTGDAHAIFFRDNAAGRTSEALGSACTIYCSPSARRARLAVLRAALRCDWSRFLCAAVDGGPDPHYNLLKEEAVKTRATAARQAVERTPENKAALQEQERSAQCQEIFEQRQTARRSNGKSIETLRISGSEPEAMVQRLKRGRGFGASFKPSVLASEDRIITAFAVDPSSETVVIAPMLDQSARVTGENAGELLLDAGYFDDEVIDVTLARDISLLCPEGQWPAKTKDEGLFHKSAFSYDAHTDTYRCPAGQTLILFSKCGVQLHRLQTARELYQGSTRTTHQTLP